MEYEGVSFCHEHTELCETFFWPHLRWDGSWFQVGACGVSWEGEVLIQSAVNSEGALFTQPWRVSARGEARSLGGDWAPLDLLAVSPPILRISHTVWLVVAIWFFCLLYCVFLKVLVSCLCVSFELCLQDLRQQYECRPAYYISINTKIINLANTLLVKRVLLFCLDNYTFIVTWKCGFKFIVIIVLQCIMYQINKFYTLNLHNFMSIISQKSQVLNFWREGVGDSSFIVDLY